MIRRTQTHITDTLAIREIMSKLPSNWLVRGLEERDYGIDLSIELFDGENPTGCFSLIQVKGTNSGFDESVQLSNFPTKTLEYALLFPEPFFIFHTSVKDKKTYFVWAQKYVQTRLSKDKASWTEQDSNTIYFPSENVLDTPEGNLKIEEVMKVLAAKQSGLEFLADFEWLNIHWEHYKNGELGVIDRCIEIAKNLLKHKLFYQVYLPSYDFVKPRELYNLLELAKAQPLSDPYYPSDDEHLLLYQIDRQVIGMGAVKMEFLDQHDMDIFEEEYSSTSPY